MYIYMLAFDVLYAHVRNEITLIQYEWPNRVTKIDNLWASH